MQDKTGISVAGAVWRDLSQAELDAQYDQRTAVPHVAEYSERWQRRSEALRRTARFVAHVYGPAPEERLGVEPMAAHLFVLYFGMMSMITPPVAIAAFAAASISAARPMQTALQAMIFGWPAYVLPFAFALNPALILHGSPAAVALAIATASAGVAAVCVAIAGQLRGPLPWPARLGMLALGAALLIWPAFRG